MSEKKASLRDVYSRYFFSAVVRFELRASGLLERCSML
jgi:hypothetical protein